MTATLRTQARLKLPRTAKRDVRSQFAALCWRRKGKGIEVCLVTTRRNGNWIIPKGWPMHNATPAGAAAVEAWEEAGLRGTAGETCLGVFTYLKRAGREDLTVAVMVYAIEVTEEAEDWPERRQRKRKWMSPKKASKRVGPPGLKRLIARFAP